MISGASIVVHPPKKPVFSLAPGCGWSGSQQTAGNRFIRPDLACRLLFSGCTIKPTGPTSAGRDRRKPWFLWQISFSGRLPHLILRHYLPFGTTIVGPLLKYDEEKRYDTRK